MPDTIKEDDKEIKNKKTNPGLSISAGEITQSDWDEKPFREKQADYRKMRNGSGIIAGNLKASKLPLLNAGWFVDPGRKTEKALEAAKYIEWQFKNLRKGFNYFRRHCLLALEHGCSFFERVQKNNVKYNNGTSNKTTNIYSYFSPIQLDTISGFNYDSDMIFTDILHDRREPDNGGKDITVEAEKLFYNTWDEEYDNVQGMSILRPVRDAWDMKKKVARGLSIAISRCGGIAVGTQFGSPDPKIKEEGRLTLRTIANSENTYVQEHKDKWEFRLEAIQGIGEGRDFLELLIREIFFNSLNQFMIAGIGQNGSRAATGEHKTTFELATVNILNWLEERLQNLSNDMMKIGYLSSIPVDDWPKFKFNNINQIDMLKAMQQIAMAYEKGVMQKRPGDEKYMREFFGYPDILETKPATGEVDNPEGKQQFDKGITSSTSGYANIKMPCTCGLNHTLDIKKQRQLTEFEKNVYQFENAEKVFLEVQDEAIKTIDNVIVKMLKDAADQVKFNKDKDINIRFGSELTNRLTKLYSQSFKEGEKDLNIELSKVDKNKTLELTPKAKVGVNKKIDLRVKRLQNSMKTNLEGKLGSVTNEFINKRGGLDAFIMDYQDKFKTDRRNLITETQSGYTSGRGAAIKENQKQIKNFICTVLLDSNLCDECAPFDSVEATLQEWIDQGFNPFGSPTNSNCLGGNTCRCHLIPSEVFTVEDIS